MVTISHEVVEGITRRLVEALHPQRIYLFGSRAYGSPDQESDLDLLIVVPAGDERVLDLDVRARRAVGDVGCGVDVLVYTSDEFDRRAAWRANFEHAVHAKGRLLYRE